MITEAYIAGSIKKAIFGEKGHYYILKQSDDEKFVTYPVNNFDLNSFYLVKPEITVVKNIQWDENQLLKELQKDSQKKEALDFFLMGMDTTFNNELRQEAMEFYLEISLSNKEIEIFVKNRIFSTTIPEIFDPLSAYKITKTIVNKNLLHIYDIETLAWLYKNLSEANNIIITVRDVWKGTILKETFINHDLSIEFLDKIFTDNGIFTDFVLAILTETYKNIDNAIIKHAVTLKKLNISGQPGIWLNSIKNIIFEKLGISNQVTNKQRTLIIDNDEKMFYDMPADDFETKFTKLIDNYKGKKQRRKENKQKKPHVAINYNNINDQVLWIKTKIEVRKMNEAHKAILSLIEFQDLYSDKEHLCKSLSDVAGSFQIINDIEMAELMAKKAIELNINDPVPYCILAENLRIKNQLQKALNYYDKIISNFIHDPVPRNGKAGTLRQMGKLSEALKVYEDTSSDFRNDVVCRCGKAETLREMGRLSEALKEYEDTIFRFGNDVVPRSGKAETLREMGRLSEALKEYEDTILRFGNDVVPRNGKAETLREMGNLSEALKEYENTIHVFKYNVVARSGRAETLRQMGRLSEALKEYENTIRDFRNDVVPHSGKAETLRQMGRLSEALKEYEDTILRFGNDVVPRSGKAETLRQMGRLQEALKEYEDTIRDFENDVIVRNGKVETLRQLGRLEEALKLYEEIKLLFPYDQVSNTSRLVLLIQLGKNLNQVKKTINISDPKSSDDWILNHIYCMYLIKQNNIDDAIGKLEMGLKKIESCKIRLYYKNALSYAYIKKKQYNKAVVNLKDDTYLPPVAKVLLTHALAAEGKIIESKMYFESILDSQINIIDKTARYLSDRYKIVIQRFSSYQLDKELDDKIEELEFDLLTETFLLAA
jgi:tetratricopeptide (TPR) repeat protein